MMAKSLHSSKNKKSNSFKPYDVSNSLVRRVTSRVSQLLPQPSSWLNRFLSSKPTPDTSHVDSQEEEEEFVQPPAKRMRHVCTSTDLPRQSTTIINRAILSTNREEEISPIRSVSTNTRQDFAVAGPSGLGRKDFVSSTPANHDHLVAPKINGDEFSDSESASCSSLPPPVQDAEHSSLLRTLNVTKRNVPSIPTPSVRGRPPLYRSKERKIDLSATSFPARGRISFDRTVFNSPFKGRLGNSSLSSSLLNSSRDESTFYSGPTMYGGASSSSDSILRTRILHSEVPEIVKPSEPARPSSSNLASSTVKILKALEQFSTPVLEAKKMPVREGGIKRKAPAPYRELLVIPQMPDLLRIKRRDARRMERRPSAETSAASKAASWSSSSAPVQQSSNQELAQRLKTDEVVAPKKAKESSTEKSFDKPAPPSLEPNTIPCLNFSSLPKFDPGIVKPITQATKPPQTLEPPSKPKETTIGPTSSTYFKFSKPITVSEGVTDTIASIPLNKKFSQPLKPETSKPLDKVYVDSTRSSLSNCVGSRELDANVMTYTPPSNVTLKLKSTSNGKSVAPINEIKSMISMTMSKTKSFVNTSAGSQKWECSQCYVSNEGDKKSCVACDSPKDAPSSKETNKTGFGDKFKISSQEWECDSCLVRNKISDSKCVACGQSKGGEQKEKPKTAASFGDKFKPVPGSWECQECLVSNKASDTTCIACSSSKDGKSSAPPLSSVFKKPTGSWECSECLVQNKSDANKCVACESKRPGFKEDPKPVFSFGVPNTEEKPVTTFSFGLPQPASTSVPSANFKFGVQAPVVTEPTSTPVTFSFGMPPKTDKAEEKPSEVGPKQNSLFSQPLKKNIFHSSSSMPSRKSEAATEELTSKSADVKPLFSFGNLTKDSSNNGTVTSTCTASSSVPLLAPSSTAFNSEKVLSSNVVSSANEVKPSVPNPIFSFGMSSAPLSTLNKENCISQESKPISSLFNATSTSAFNDIKSTDSGTTKSKVFNFLNKNDNFTKSDNKQVAFTFGSNGGVEAKTVAIPNQEQKQEGGFMFNLNKNDTQNTSSMPLSDTSKPFLSQNFNNSGFGASFGGPKTIADKPPDLFNSHSTSGGFSMKPAENSSNPISFGFGSKDPPPTNQEPPSSLFGANRNHTNSFPSGQQGSSMVDGFSSSQPSSTFGGTNSVFNSVPVQQVPSATFTFGTGSDRTATLAFPPQGGVPGNSLGGSSTGAFAFGQNSTTPHSFDPNVKPTYKFSTGSTPTFSATAVNPVAEPIKKHPDRVIRKAVRRTTQK